MIRQLKFCHILFGFSAFAITTSQALAEIKMEVIPAFAPNGQSSPSWSQYVSNAIDGISSGTDLGDRSTDASAYELISGPIHPHEIVYTSFRSWRSMAEPNSKFQEPFLGESGNRVHFGLHVAQNGGDLVEFALRDLTWQLDSDDLDGFFDASGDFSRANYSNTRVGVNFGADGIKGTDDDMVYSSDEDGSNAIHELMYVGVGDGFFSQNEFAETDQDDINMTLSSVLSGCGGEECTLILSGSYSLPDPSGTGEIMAASESVAVIIPEPTSMTLLSLGLLALATRRRHGK